MLTKMFRRNNKQKIIGKSFNSNGEYDNDFDANRSLILNESIVMHENETDNFKSDLKQIIKNIEDITIEDYVIVNSVDSVITSTFEGRKLIHRSLGGNEYYTLLHYAAKNCRYLLCEYLIDELKLDVDSLSKSKMTPLHVIIKSNALESSTNASTAYLQLMDTNKIKFINTFGLLIQRGANYNLQDEYGNSALHHAAMVNNFEAALILTNLKNINFLTENKLGLTPLHIACQQGKEELACLLIEKTNISNLTTTRLTSPNLPIHLACRNKGEKILIVRQMIDRLKKESPNELKNVLMAKVDTSKQNVLGLAIENNHMNIVDLLLGEFYLYNNEIDFEDKNGNLPIHLAAKNGSIELLEIIIKNNAFSIGSNSLGENPLHLAAANNKFEFIKAFLSYESQFIKDNELTSQLSSYLCPNQQNQTPLFLAIINGHKKCAEYLAMLDNVDLKGRDLEGNTIYHLCAEYNSFEVLQFFLSRKENKFLQPIYLKNYQEETVLHVACKQEKLEIIKLILNKLIEFNESNEKKASTQSLESFLTSRNKSGRTFFHLACIKGFLSIIEYFLRELKITYLIELQDNDLNKPIHLASLNGHLFLVNLLLDFGADVISKNKDGNNPLELSCKNGHFEISKSLLNRFENFKLKQLTYGDKDNALHVACQEGAHEVVKLLLQKGAEIDTLNSQSKNCLDVAIEKGHREVIKVLLRNENWHKLFHTNLDNESSLINIVMDLENKSPNIYTKNINLKTIYRKENPQMNAMYDKKMWDMIKIVLDNCKKVNDEINHANGEHYDFKKLDPKFKSIHTHPLMLLAKSGQESLLKHDTTRLLLNLKWRYAPRILFYGNCLFYLLYLILFSIYTIQLSTFFDNSYEAFSGSKDHESRLNSTMSQNIYFESEVSFYLIIIFLLSMLKKLFQVLLIDGISFFFSLPNWFELVTYIFAFTSVVSNNMQTKFTFGSIAILFSYIEFSFLIQKFKVFGIYVLAFKRTLKNSAKFFPMFVLIYTGFIFSFRLRMPYGVTYFNTTASAYLVKSLAMVVGELETSQMGLDEGYFVNYLIYTLFISLMCVVLLNLFVGIAVGEISTLLSEADLQQISMRIIFVLKCQESLRPFSEMPILKKCLDIRYAKYSYTKESRLVRCKDILMKFLCNLFTTKDPIIKLVDPQKRLEDNLIDLAAITNNDLKIVKNELTNKITDLAVRIKNSQQRLESSLFDNSIKSVSNLENSKLDTANHLNSVESNLMKSQQQLKYHLRDLFRNTESMLLALKQSFCSRFTKIEEKIVKPVISLENSMSTLTTKTNQISKNTNDEFRNLNQSVNCLAFKINDIQLQIYKLTQDMSELVKILHKSEMNNLKNQINFNKSKEECCIKPLEINNISEKSSAFNQIDYHHSIQIIEEYQSDIKQEKYVVKCKKPCKHSTIAEHQQSYDEFDDDTSK